MIPRLLGLFPLLLGLGVIRAELRCPSALLVLAVIPVMMGGVVALFGMGTGRLRIGVFTLWSLLTAACLGYILSDLAPVPAHREIRFDHLELQGRRRCAGGGCEAFSMQVDIRQPGRELSWSDGQRQGALKCTTPTPGASLLPTDWTAECKESPTALMWVAPEAVSASQTTWESSPRGASSISWLAPLGAAARLTRIKSVGYPVKYDGRRCQLRAVLLRDAKNNSYTVLDDPKNPLILKFVPNRFTVGFLFLDGIFIWTPINYLILNDGYSVTRLGR